MVGPRKSQTEYGGDRGSINPAADGHVELTAREGARVIRTYGIRAASTSAESANDVVVDGGVDAATGEKWTDPVQEQRKKNIADIEARLNYRKPGEVK